MKYELETFHRIISGDLDPARQSADATPRQLAYIRQHSSTLIVRYLARFESNNKGTCTLVSYRQFGALSSETNRVVCPLWVENDSDRLSELSGQFVRELEIDPHTITEANLFAADSRYLLSLVVARDLNNLSADEIRYWYYNQLLFQETERFKRSFHDHVFRLESEEKIRLFVQNHQGQLETFTDMILEQIPVEERKHIHQTSSDYALTDVFKLIYQYLEVGLAHIERHFTKYLNMTTRVPYRSKVLFSEALSDKVSFILTRLEGSSISSPLAEILSKPLARLADIQEDEDFTYHDLHYYKRFLLEFYRVLSQENSVVTDALLIDTLYQANYNSVDFINFLANQIRREVEKQRDIIDQSEVLYGYLKEYNQRHCKTSIPCYGETSVQEQMVSWLDEEISYRTRVMEANVQRNAARSYVKLETSLSVNGVIYLLQLQKDVGLITNEFHTDVMSSIADNVSTRRTKNISLNSISKKYYDVEDSTKRKVREYLQAMIDLINQSVPPDR